MIIVNNLSVHFSGDYLFEDISFIINNRDRIGLVGKNGAGKTTLMRILNGELSPEKGNISHPKDITIGYLPQEIKLRSNKTVMDETLTAFKEELELEKTINSINEKISGRDDYGSEKYNDLVQKLAEATERFELLDGSRIKVKVEKVLRGLGFLPGDIQKPMKEFSGGWQMRVELAKILLKKPNLVMLDEPTNHLDIQSIQWLEDYLTDYPGAVMVVSHDRAFLDNITTRTIEVSNGKVYDYKASFSDYENMRRERMEIELAAMNNQQKQIAQIEQFIERFRYKATKAKQVQSKIKFLEKMDKADVDEIDQSSIYFRFPQTTPSGKIVLEASDITKAYGEKEVLKDLSFSISRGEKIAFVGKNGEGKTTLSRIIVNDLDYTGTLKIGHNVTIGYFAQNQDELLDPNKTVFQTLDDIAVGDVRKNIRGILGGFLFIGEDVDKKVKVLSGGEKSRLAIAKMLLSPANLLVLDEPTNHLDIRSKDILKNALLQFKGTVIVVSHDRDFLNGLTNKIFEFKNKNISEYPGGVYEYLESRKIDQFDDLEAAGKAKKTSKPTTADPSGGKLEWESRKRYESMIRKLKNRISDKEEKIEKLEKELKTLENQMSDSDKSLDAPGSEEIFDKYNKIKKSLESEEKEWEKLNLELEDLIHTSKTQ